MKRSHMEILLFSLVYQLTSIPAGTDTGIPNLLLLFGLPNTILWLSFIISILWASLSRQIVGSVNIFSIVTYERFRCRLF